MAVWLVAATLAVVAVVAAWGMLRSDGRLGRLAVQVARKLTYFPDTHLAWDPSAAGLVYESVHFQAADGVTLHGWWIPGPEPSTATRPAVLFFHGNAGNIADRLGLAVEIHRRLGLSIFLVDYRGFGLSEGTPSEEGLYRDGRAAIAEMAQRGWSSDGLVIFGRSLGAAVTLGITAEAQASVPSGKPFGLVLEAPFTTLAEMGRHHYPLLGMLTSHLKEERYDNRAKAARLTAPLLLIHGEDDQVAPMEMGRAIFDAVQGPKQWLEIRGAGHNDPPDRNPVDYWNGWGSFLREYVLEQQQAGTQDR